MFSQSLFTVDALGVSSKTNLTASSASNIPRFASYQAQAKLGGVNTSTIEIGGGPVIFHNNSKVEIPDGKYNKQTGGKISYDSVLKAFDIKDRQSNLKSAQSNIVTYSSDTADGAARLGIKGLT